MSEGSNDFQNIQECSANTTPPVESRESQELLGIQLKVYKELPILSCFVSSLSELSKHQVLCKIKIKNCRW